MYLQLEKFNTFRGRDKKSTKADRTSFRPPGMEEFSGDGDGDANVQLLVNRMSEAEVNSKFEQMLVSTVVLYSVCVCVCVCVQGACVFAALSLWLCVSVVCFVDKFAVYSEYENKCQWSTKSKVKH